MPQTQNIINDWQPKSNVHIIAIGTLRQNESNPANFNLLNMLFYDK